MISRDFFVLLRLPIPLLTLLPAVLALPMSNSKNIDLSALAEKTRQRLSRLSASAGERLFASPRPIRDVLRPGVSFATTPSRPPPDQFDSSHGAGVGAFGEFSVSSGFSGGGSGDLTLFVLSSEMKSSLCLGSVAKGLKFCTSGAGVCLKTSHTKKIEVVVGDLYLSAGRNSAFSNHHIPATVLSPTQLDAILKERHTKEEWVRLLHAWNSKVSDDAINVAAQDNPFAKVGALMVSTAVTPARKRKAIYGGQESLSEDDSIPNLAAISGLSSSSEQDDDFQVIPMTVDAIMPEDKLPEVLTKWDTLVHNFNQIAKHFKKLRSALGDDIEFIQDKLSVVDSKIGARPKQEYFDDCMTAWEGLSCLQQGLEEVSSSWADSKAHFASITDANTQAISDHVAKTSAQMNTLKSELQEVINVVGILGDEQEMLLNRNAVAETTSIRHGVSPFPVQEEFTALKLRLDACEESLRSHHGAPDRTTSLSGGAFKEVQDLKLQLKQLAARIPSNSVLKLGGLVFQSREDVLMFVETKMPSNGYYYFHDAVTLLESLSGSFSEKKEILNEYYQSMKVGVNAQEARHLASFRTTLPYVFGHEKDGVPHTSKHAIPAVKSFREWNPFDQDSGVMNFIIKGIHDLKFQIPQDINNELAGEEFAEARRLALDMHSYSHFFIGEMCTWVTGFVQELSLQSSEEEAWTLASQCLKSVFVHLRTVRSPAANAFSDPNKLSRCTTFMWCLWESHRLMKEFLDSSFRNHPCIAPVITLHLFRTRVTKNAFTEAIKRLEGRINSLEKTNSPKGANNRNDNQGAKKGDNAKDVKA